MNIGVVVSNDQYRDLSMPWRELKAGLKTLGHNPVYMSPGSYFDNKRPLDMCFIWNGAKNRLAKVGADCIEHGIQCIRLERGFFDRFRYTQFDHAGFNHTASWRDCFDNATTTEQADRFEAICGEFAPMQARKDGYVLVLLQVPTDAQLVDSEIHHPDVLVELIEACTPGDLDIKVRHHPLFEWKCNEKHRSENIAGTLEDNIAGARFCIMINSNAGNDALRAGCPVLALGPSLYTHAGVALKTTVVTMIQDIRRMCDGWCPEAHAVQNYLYWLTSRQWNHAEIAQGDCLKPILEAAING